MKKVFAIGVDIGGTKCAVCLGEISRDSVKIVHKCKIHETARFSPQEMLEQLSADILSCVSHCSGTVEGIGVSCGGPLDSKNGIILSSPNLPGWDHIAVTAYFREKTGLAAYLCNDANACALAE
jgi:glucokinase